MSWLFVSQLHLFNSNSSYFPETPFHSTLPPLSISSLSHWKHHQDFDFLLIFKGWVLRYCLIQDSQLNKNFLYYNFLKLITINSSKIIQLFSWAQAIHVLCWSIENRLITFRQVTIASSCSAMWMEFSNCTSCRTKPNNPL